jgi:D-alanyl-lipoteichoic acid acyltransferase DltB (MBOAT superfamily)
MLNFLLPVGISFYTFECFSYVIDVYRGSLKPEKSILRFFLFVTYFPKLVAGPIVRSDHILPQLRVFKNFKEENFRKGLTLILWGLFKKMVIADRLAISVNHVYNNVKGASSLSLIIATIFFTYQIYCDFSGYSDIAIGVSKLLGIDLMENFRRPYFSKTVTEFWRRWHISLSSWFRDYLYIPLGGSRVSVGRWVFNSIFVFLISGLWHGANYTFLIWGGIHGVMIVVEKFYYGKNISKIKSGVTPANIVRWAITYFVVMVGWIFFRANTLHDSIAIIRKIVDFGNFGNDVKAIFTQGGAEGLLGLNFYDFILAVLFPLILVSINFKVRKSGLVNYVYEQSTFKRWSLYLLATFIIFWFGKFGVNEFIYFQF